MSNWRERFSNDSPRDEDTHLNDPELEYEYGKKNKLKCIEEVRRVAFNPQPF